MVSFDFRMMEQVSRQILIVLLNASLKGFLIAVFVYILVSFGKRISAKTLHLVWFLSIASFLILPVLSFLLPPLRFGIFQLQENSGKVYQTFASVVSVDLSFPGDIQMAASQMDQGLGEAASVLPMLRWTFCLLVWLAGFLAAFSRTHDGTVKARKIVQNGKRVQQNRIVSLLESLRAGSKVKRPVQLYSSAQFGSPFTIGISKPVIVIPEDMASWSITDLKPVLLHELLHIQRLDYLTQTVSMVICSVFWFVPVVWIACRRLYSEQERACDEEVVGSGINPRHYVNQMLKTACFFAASNTAPGLFKLNGRRKLFEKRIIDILTKRGAVMKKKSAIYIICFCIIAFTSNMLCVAQEAYDFKFPETDEPIYGTWINEEYAGNTVFPQKVIYLTWGYGKTYHTITETMSPTEWTFVLVEKWNDTKGNTLYMVYLQYQGGKDYILARVSRDGTKLEEVWGAGFPKERDLNPKNTLYRIWYRQ